MGSGAVQATTGVGGETVTSVAEIQHWAQAAGRGQLRNTPSVSHESIQEYLYECGMGHSSVLTLTLACSWSCKLECGAAHTLECDACLDTLRSPDVGTSGQEEEGQEQASRGYGDSQGFFGWLTGGVNHPRGLAASLFHVVFLLRRRHLFVCGSKPGTSLFSAP